MSTEAENIEIFRELVEIWARERINKIYSNAGPHEANIVMSTIFKYSKKSVKIFAKDLNGVISECDGCDDSFFINLNSFLQQPKSKLEVIIESLPEKKTNQQLRFYNLLLQRAQVEQSKPVQERKVEFKKATTEFLNDNKKLRIDELKSTVPYDPINYAIGDETIFRYQYDSSRKAAKFSFNNENIVNFLKNNFDSYFNQLPNVVT